MATKSRNPHDDSQRQETQTLMSEQARQQLVIASEMSSVMCRAAEALQQIQQHMTQRAALRYQQMAEQMRGAKSSAEMFAFQSTLMAGGLQEVAQYMQDMTKATLQIQSLMLNHSHAQDGVQMAGQAASAAMNAWQSAMGAGNGSQAAQHH